MFQSLARIQLDDNKITAIDRRAFMNLNQLQYLTLRGNKIQAVADEAFQVTIFIRYLNVMISTYMCLLLLKTQPLNASILLNSQPLSRLCVYHYNTLCHNDKCVLSHTNITRKYFYRKDIR